MKKFKSDDFSTNRAMLDKDVLRYCESFYQYLNHLVTYFGYSLTIQEFRVLNFLIQRIDLFLKDAPVSELTHQFVGRYSRLVKHLKKLQNGLNINSSDKDSISVTPSCN